MSASGEEARYYIGVDGKQDGPFRLGELLEAGVGADTLVWVPGSEGWLPAHELPEVARLLDKQGRRLGKVSRKARRLPDPEIFGKLRLAILCVDAAAGVFFIIGSTALLTSLVLMFATDGAARMALLVGLLPAILGLILLVVEAGLVAAFLWNCFRIVKVLAPDRNQGDDFSWRDWVQVELDEGPIIHDRDDPTHVLGPRDGGNVLLVVVSIIPISCIILGPILLLYTPFGLAIYRLGYGLDRVTDRYRLCDHGVPWAPIPLGFFTALSGLLLFCGPLSGAFFILLPIWIHRTAKVAASICRTDPALFVKDKPPVVTPTGPPPSPFDMPQDAAKRG